ncbi:biotin/lipoyl-containing protein [Acetobacter okinawensis]|uniref:Lipoyl-binding domain-containing protein n=1 Tax=Acetobacter okinawensis TaxID=1076594 RepID=A0A252BT96_9PROT|nr:biotin/lipoyl-containing protein [Acetobacter okinawensis]OUJ11996.1 hypothetical protein HK26_05375 [Acetobacter okinawensis]
MEKPITLPAFEALPTPQDLAQITHWLQQAGLHELELTNAQGLRLRLVANTSALSVASPSLPSTAPTAPAKPTSTPILTPYFGHLRLQDVATDKAFVTVGQTVQQGQTVGMLDLGSITVAIQAPGNGVLSSICAQEGDLVGYGHTIAFITPS